MCYTVATLDCLLEPNIKQNANKTRSDVASVIVNEDLEATVPTKTARVERQQLQPSLKAPKNLQSC